MKALAIIPARGGSKTIPRKNVLPLAGKPLIAHTILAARHAQHIGRVIVSTDDAEIGAISTAYGAEVVWRPAAISGDTASSESALLHVLDQLHAQDDSVPAWTVFLQCTSPLTLPADIDATVQAVLDAEAETGLAVTPFHYFLWQATAAGDAVGINHDKRVRLRRQDREPQYVETGAIYVMQTAGFRHAQHRFFGRTAMYVMPPERCLEIDEPVDFTLAEVLLHRQQSQYRRACLPDPVRLLVLDFDGVLTDNRVWVDQDGRESVACSRGDGMGLSRLRQLGIPVLVLSKEQNPVVAARCRKLQLPCYHGIDDKAPLLRQLAAERDIPLSHVVYVGNDVNDAECLQIVGCGVVVADAHPAVRPLAQLILTSAGGFGAVRELCDLIEHYHNEKDSR